MKRIEVVAQRNGSTPAESPAAMKAAKRAAFVEQRRKALAYAMQRNIQQLEKMIRSRVSPKSN